MLIQEAGKTLSDIELVEDIKEAHKNASIQL